MTFDPQERVPEKVYGNIKLSPTRVPVHIIGVTELEQAVKRTLQRLSLGVGRFSDTHQLLAKSEGVN